MASIAMGHDYEELLRRAELEELKETLDGYPLQLTGVLLARHGVEGSLRKLRGMKETLEELRRMEATADLEELFREFKRGDSCVHSKDRKGRPILWTKARSNIRREKPPFTEIILRDLWVVLWSYRKRESLDEGVLLAFNDTSRSILDFNVGYIREIARLSDGLFPVIQDKHIFFCSNSTLKLIGNLGFQSLNYLGFESQIHFSDNREEIFDEMQDPSAYPDVFMNGGAPYTMSFDMLGNWRDLVYRRQGFSNITIADIYRPDPAKIAELRQTVAEEEAAIFDQVEDQESIDKLDQGPSIKSILDFSEDASEDNESINNANEFLM